MLTKKPRLPVKDIALFGFLPSWLKTKIYRLRGYRIGKQVSIGLGSVIIGSDVDIDDHASFGFFTIIRGKKIRIGSHVSIGSTTFIDTPNISIGDGSKINEQVFIGGLQFPDSKFTMGRNCQIMQMSFINPSRSITIGDDTGIGGHSLIFGHTSWLSQLEGYEVSFDSIEIGNNVSLAWRVFLLPGCKIGDGSVIGANSLVHRTIPPKCLAVGFPARVVSKSPDFPKSLTDTEKTDLFKNIVRDMISFFKGNDLECIERTDNLFEINQRKKSIIKNTRRQWFMQVVTESISEQINDIKNAGCHLVVSLHSIPDEARVELDNNKIGWLDIENKEQPFVVNDLGEEVSDFLKRYGIRLFKIRQE